MASQRTMGLEGLRGLRSRPVCSGGQVSPVRWMPPGHSLGPHPRPVRLPGSASCVPSGLHLALQATTICPRLLTWPHHTLAVRQGPGLPPPPRLYHPSPRLRLCSCTSFCLESPPPLLLGSLNLLEPSSSPASSRRSDVASCPLPPRALQPPLPRGPGHFLPDRF